MDALGVGEFFRHQSPHLERETAITGALTSQLFLTTKAKSGEHEVRCVKRNLLLETLEKELPQGSIRYSSKPVSIEEDDDFKLLHLVDGSTLKTKVLIGCNGVNSLVAKWLGLKKPAFCGRSASRGFTLYPDGHGFKSDFTQYFGKGFRFGLQPYEENSIYWFFTWTPTSEEKEVGDDATKMKQFMLDKLRASNVPIEAIENGGKERNGHCGLLSTQIPVTI